MIIYSDGFTLISNPSPIGGGYTIVDEFDNLIKTETIYKKGMTNNEAELLGVLEALRLCSHQDTVVTDSRNTMAWIKSGNPKARPDLKDLCSEAKKLVSYKQVSVIWKPRAVNLAGIYNEEHIESNAPSWL
jgi:ribonuclease HI